ncbi:MAG: ABC transporter substrate-binding protein [Legionella sp.]|nr:ABC transporter substrate-binding protein [Legionella sp.]
MFLSKLKNVSRRRMLLGMTALAVSTFVSGPQAFAADTMKVGLIASLSGPSAKSGEAITRGLTIAINEINAAGGLLGKKLELLRRDDEANPGKGLVAARELIQREKVALLFGGLQTPVSLAIVHQCKALVECSKYLLFGCAEVTITKTVMDSFFKEA